MKIKRIMIHILILLLLSLAVVKYAEEIVDLKHSSASRLKDAWRAMQQDENRIAYGRVDAGTGDEWYYSTRLIYHAGGVIDGVSYTNSREALEQTMQQGNYLVEIDFMYTADDVLICGHGWPDFYALEPISWEEIRTVGIYRKYTPMTAADLIQIMEAEPQLMVVIDTKEKEPPRVIEELIRLSEGKTEILNRFIVQLYDENMKQEVMERYEFPRENLLFTAYKFGTDRVDEILRLCIEENICVVAVGSNDWSNEVIAKFRACGITVFEHTINDAAEARKTISRGVQGVYTDSLQPSDLAELGK